MSSHRLMVEPAHCLRRMAAIADAQAEYLMTLI